MNFFKFTASNANPISLWPWDFPLTLNVNSKELDLNLIDIPGLGLKWTFQGTRLFDTEIGNLTVVVIIGVILWRTPYVGPAVSPIVAAVYSYVSKDLWYREDNDFYLLPDRILPQGHLKRTWIYINRARTVLLAYIGVIFPRQLYVEKWA